MDNAGLLSRVIFVRKDFVFLFTPQTCLADPTAIDAVSAISSLSGILDFEDDVMMIHTLIVYPTPVPSLKSPRIRCQDTGLVSRLTSLGLIGASATQNTAGCYFLR